MNIHEYVLHFWMYSCRQRGARIASHLQPHWSLRHFDPVCACGCPHRRHTHRPHRAVPRKFPLSYAWRLPCSTVMWLISFCVYTGAQSHPADVVPHQGFQLAASLRHCSGSTHAYQHAGHFRPQHSGHLRNYRLVHIIQSYFVLQQYKYRLSPKWKLYTHRPH